MENRERKSRIAMLLVAIGIVYGDIGTSPMYVMKSIISGNGGISNVDADFIIGSLSLVIWTITLLTTVKYVLLAMKADNCGEGGIFSLYALVRKQGKWMIIPAMLGGAALLADGLLTPAVTVTTAVEGLRSIELMNTFLGEGQKKVVIITLIIISVLFSLQHNGTSKIGKAFGPVMMFWFTFIGICGLAIMLDVPQVLKAFNPVYAAKILVSPNNKSGFMILGSVFLATTGAEALYSDMGHVGKNNIYISWPFVKICLILNYLGQGAWIIKNINNENLYAVSDLNPFFMMLPDNIKPVAVILGSAAAVIASQALITGSYTLVSEAIHLDLLPHLEIKYPSDTKGQMYIKTVNDIMWIGCCLVVLYFRSGAKIESAYGLAITLTMLMTTLLLSVYIGQIKKKKILSAAVFVIFGLIESVFFISSLGKFSAGGYVTVLITLILLMLEIIWYRGTEIERNCSPLLNMRDYISKLRELHQDETIPLTADNLVYLDSNTSPEKIDRDVLYSILDKDHKRANAYWFINVNVVNEPKMLNYKVETYGTDFIFCVQIELGFKEKVGINEYIRQIVCDLQKSGEMPHQDRKYTIYGRSTVGTFKFCTIYKTITGKSELGDFDYFIMNAKYLIRRLAGSKVQWYGLDTSSNIVEKVPLMTNYKYEINKISRVN